MLPCELPDTAASGAAQCSRLQHWSAVWLRPFLLHAHRDAVEPAMAQPCRWIRSAANRCNYNGEGRYLSTSAVCMQGKGFASQ